MECVLPMQSRHNTLQGSVRASAAADCCAHFLRQQLISLLHIWQVHFCLASGGTDAVGYAMSQRAVVWQSLGLQSAMWRMGIGVGGQGGQ